MSDEGDDEFVLQFSSELVTS